MNIETDSTVDPICPHCGHAVRDSWELDFGTSEEYEHMCCECEKDFVITRNVSVDYTTMKKETK